MTSHSTTAPAKAHGLDPSLPGHLPDHLAVIMDGNGRWAKARGLPRIEGHRRGLEALRNLVRAADKRGIRFVTVYSFSSENWRRPAEEVSELLGLLRYFIRQDVADLSARNVRIRIIGRRDDLPDDIGSLLREAETSTAQNTGLTLIIAFNYGARDELLRAAQSLAAQVADGCLAVSKMTEQHLSDALDTCGLPDPDLLIRTSGEVRLSNFLMWQLAYTELVFLPIAWPDFDSAALDGALVEFSHRHRRFGGLNEETAGQSRGQG
jgi:undecaprenyl diphosphate synthase